MARNDRLQLKQMTADDMTLMDRNRTWGPIFKKVYRVVNGGRAVVIILDENCVRWMGYARGIELTCLGKKPATGWDRADLSTGNPAELDKHNDWTAVNGRHEFHNGDEAKCIRNALRWVNKTASWVYARA